MQIRYPALDEMRLTFLKRCPGFADFGMRSGVYFESEREYKQPILEAFAQIISRGGGQTDGEIGDLLLKAMIAPPANFVGWRTTALFTVPERRAGVAAVLGGMIRSEAEVGEAVQLAARAVFDLLQPVAQGAIFGGVRTLVTTALAFARPDQAVSVKTHYMAKAARQLTGKSIFHKNHVTAEEYRSFLALCWQVRERLEDWGWKPHDLWDVQGFLWVVSQEEWHPGKQETFGGKSMQESQRYALNTILAGPPGTGKTYRTAEMAVKICEGNVPADRKELMAAYRRLQEANRVVFTTFHQSMSYEEFVEGLRPVVEEEASVQGENERSPAAAAGLRLEARNGIFRDLCAQAEAATRRTGNSAGFALGDRSFYKMSLGQRWVEEDVYQAALDGNYVVLGWGGDLDWSDPKYSDYTEVQARWKTERNETKAGNSGDVIQVARFRSMKEHDLIIVADGNTRFRAIGEVAGEYEFKPGTLGGNHCRPVKWLLKLTDSLPVETIYNARFSMAACYQIYGSEVKKPALEELLRPPANTGEPVGGGVPYVLIVDEINRANISKVLGELITLLEPDKRLGAENELTVTLPYSRTRFGVPKNLYVIGTMNTADRSIAPLDTALRRRFEFEQMTPDYDVLKGKEVDGIPLEGLLRAINDRIEWLFDRDHLLGHAYLIHVQTREELDRTMRNKIVPLLAEYFFEDWAKVRSALNDHSGWFVAQAKLGRPAMEEEEGRTHFRYDLRYGAVPQEAYKALLGLGPGAAGA